MRYHSSRVAAFTLLELLTVLLVIAILFAMVAGLYGEMRSRSEKVNCTGNLKNLYVGAEAYLQDQGHWPQIDPSLISSDHKVYADQWIAALKPYGFGISNWLCPTTQRLLSNPDMNDHDNVRVDYLAFPFDDKTITPHRWPKSPWFAERGAVHAGGNLIIYTNGAVETLTDSFRNK